MSSIFFTPQSNIGIKIQEILKNFREGLTAQHIKRELRKMGTHISDISTIERILDNSEYFVKFSKERYRLRVFAIEDSGDKEAFFEYPEKSLKKPSIINLNSCLNDYIIFDLETTGFDPVEDRIIQISALRIEGKKPVDFYNSYVNPCPKKISSNLKNILKLTEKHEKIIYSAPSVEIMYEEFLKFRKDLPLLAYNLDFDYSFLKSIDGNIEHRGVDILELAVLTIPDLKSYKLENMAEFLHISSHNLQEKMEVEKLITEFSIEDFKWTGFHDARIDVIYLYRIYLKLLERFFSGRICAVISHMFPGHKTSVRGDLKELINPPEHLCQMERKNEDIHFSEETCLEFLKEYLEKKSYEKRDGQIDMMNLVIISFLENTFKMIEAPTGTGKTLAYIVPSILFALSGRGKIAISTAVKNLQDQLLEEIKDFSEKLGLSVYYQVLKGRNSYLCLRKFADYISEIRDYSSEEGLCISYLLSWVNNTRDGTWDELSYWMEQKFPLLKDMKKTLAAERDTCSGRSCVYYDKCYRMRAYNFAKNSDIIILNHALWLSEPEDLPEFDRLILDEAHNLEDIATSSFTEEISLDIWEDFFKNIINPKTGRGLGPRLMAVSKEEELHRLVKGLFSVSGICKNLIRDMGNHFKEFVKSCNARLDEKYGATLRLERDPEKIAYIKWYKIDGIKRQLNIYLKDFGEVLVKLKKMIEKLSLPFEEGFFLNISFIQKEFLKNYSLFNEILKVNNMKKVYWIEVKEREKTSPFWALKSAPIEVAELLEEKYSSLSSLILTSATLSIRGGDFSFFANRLGLRACPDENNTHIIKGVIDYSRAFLALAGYLEYIPSPSTMDRFSEEISKELNYFLDFTDGKALVLFNSRKRMEYVAKACSDYLGKKNILLYFQEEGISKKSICEGFREDRNSVLMGLKSFWEGVDIPGESLSFVVMEKLPYPYIFNPVYRARREAFTISPEKGREFDDYIFPLMAIRFKQGFGRLLRRESDRGAVLLLDKRIHRKSYREELLSSLPGYTRDDKAENKRITLYRKIGEFLPGLIDMESKENFLFSLPEEILLNIEEKLEEFALPSVMSPEEYEEKRPELLLSLKELFGYKGFKSQEQEEVIKAILTGKDVVAILKTGAGKSLCFQLPALLRKGTTIVFSPLIALMTDQFYSLKEKGLEIVDSIHKGQTADEREEIYRRIKEGKSRLVYISPERLRDPKLLEAIKEATINNVIVDEAHCITMWGPGFRPDYLYINKIFERIDKRPPVAAFTATAPYEIKEDIIKRMDMINPAVIQGSFDRPELNFIVYNSYSGPVKNKTDKFDILLKILKAADIYREPVLVYVATTGEADGLARKLRVMGFDIRSYHGKMSGEERNNVQEMFMDGLINMVVCTKAFGMGIDKKDIRYVIHYDIPGDLESYFQETGRAGRDGKEAYAILLYNKKDLNIQKFFNKSSVPDEDLVSDIFRFLKNTGKDKIYLDTENIRDLYGLEETELKIILHILEDSGFVKRDMDFAFKACITLFKMPQDIIDFVKTNNPEDLELIEELFINLSLLYYRKKEVNLLDLSETLKIDISLLENLFIRLSMKGMLRFSPFEKGATVVLTEKGRKSGEPDFNNSEAGFAYKNRLDGKLDRMADYGENMDICRRKFILEYFGEDYPNDNCGNCDICAPEKNLPWALMTQRDVPEICDFFDPAFTVLEITKWNFELLNKPYRMPYGKKSLMLILTGNDYKLLEWEEDHKKRRVKRKRLRECPFFALLDRLPGREKTLENIFGRLESEGYIEYIRAEYNTYSYSYPVPSEKGYERLEEGTLFCW